MRVISCNVNGIRSAVAKGFWEWVRRQKVDVLCLQETRADKEQFPKAVQEAKGFYPHFCVAERRGYSGVALFSRQKPDRVVDQMGLKEMDREGRYLQADFGNLSVISIYFPSGSAKEERQTIKYEFMDFFMAQVQRLKDNKRSYIFCGDFNIAHKKIDIKNWKSNQKNSGFLPEERAWMDRLIEEVGYVDAFRVLNQLPDQYTWWSNRGQAYAKNVGWRIDYQIVSPDLKDKVQKVAIYKRKKFSDHAPLVVDYALPI